MTDEPTAALDDHGKAAAPRPVSPTTALVDLVLNPADPGYQAAAAARGDNPRPRWYDRPAVAIGCALIGFTLAVAYVHTNRGSPAAAKVNQTLADRVRAAQHDADDLAARLRQRANEVAALRDRGLPTALRSELNRAELAAGVTAVTGPGLQVVLSEPPASTPTPGPRGPISIGEAHILTDRDVRTIVNQLWAAGAEAIAVNDVRLTPTSAIRFAGEAVLIDFQPITSPYTIRAIGDGEKMIVAFADSEAASRYNTMKGALGIGFGFEQKDKMSLPATPAGEPRYASPGPTPGNR